MFNKLAIKAPGLLFFKFHKTAWEIWRLETILHKVDFCIFVVKYMKNNAFFFLLWIPAHQGAVQDQPYQLPVEIDPLIGLSLLSLFAIH